MHVKIITEACKDLVETEVSWSAYALLLLVATKALGPAATKNVFFQSLSEKPHAHRAEGS
jgi:hypothetical protein